MPCSARTLDRLCANISLNHSSAPSVFVGALLLAHFNAFQAIVLFDPHYYNNRSSVLCNRDRSSTGEVNQTTEAALGVFRT